MSGAALSAQENKIVRGITVAVETEAVPAEDVVSGAPRQGTLDLGSIGGAETGIWELRGGTVTDTEIDEVFVVISGGASIELLREPGVSLAEGVAPRVVEVGPGDVMRLVAGTRTRWTVTDHIRKVYIAAE